MTAQEIIDLVHRRDHLVSERAEIVAHLDREIAEIDEQLDALNPASNGRAIRRPDHVSEPDGRTPRAGTNTEKVIAMIRRTPTLDYGQVSLALYGEDTTATRKRLRSLLSSLNTNGWIRNVAMNTWEVLR
jgi:hypothetical protein